MKKELDLEYEISVDNILDMTSDDEVGLFEIIEAFFLLPDGESFNNVSRKVLSDGETSQIFFMKDGKYILEIEDLQEGLVDYYYSDKIVDLL